MTCPNRPTCARLVEVCSAHEMRGWEQAYCDRSSASCERRMLCDAGIPVPDDLLPDGHILVTISELEEAGG